MVKYENECVCCGLPCLGSSCPYTNVKHLYCDECGSDVDELWDGLCEECFIEDAKKNAKHTTMESED